MKRIIVIILCILFFVIGVYDIHALCVKVSKANIRMGPGTNYEKAWEVVRYMPFLKVGVSTSGNWYAIKDVDGDVNWIHNNLVTTKYHCAVVKTEQANVRRGPGTGYRKSPLSPALLYDTFKVIKRHSTWVKVKDTLGNIGWIHRDYLWIR